MRLAGTLFAAAALGCAAPLSAEVAETTASGFVTRDMAEVAATPMQTWLALIRPGAWWNDAHTWSADAANMMLTPQAGGCLCERVPGEDRADGFSLDGSVQHMVVVQAYPLKNLRMRGGLGPLQGEPATGVLTITLEEIDGGTRIRWEYVVGGYMRYEVPTIATVKFSIKYLFPGAKVQFAPSYCDNDFTSHYLPLKVCVAIILAGIVMTVL